MSHNDKKFTQNGVFCLAKKLYNLPVATEK